MLLTCKQFEVDGAPDTIRKMLPLIFAKDQGARLLGGGARPRQGWQQYTATEAPRGRVMRAPWLSLSRRFLSPWLSSWRSHQGPHCGGAGPAVHQRLGGQRVQLGPVGAQPD